MPENSIYIIDSDVFIKAARSYYAFDIAPHFWDALIPHALNNRICSIDKVQKEIAAGDDELAEWSKKHFEKYFKTTNDQDVVSCYSDIMKWARQETQYLEGAIRVLADMNNADGWLVAFAMAKGGCVVTEEKLNNDKKNRVPIPNICNAFNVPYVDTFPMLRALNIKFS